MSYFPSVMQKKLQKKIEYLPDDGKTKLFTIQDHIVQHRRIVQGLLKTAEATAPHPPVDDGDRGGGHDDEVGRRGQNFRRGQVGSGEGGEGE